VLSTIGLIDSRHDAVSKSEEEKQYAKLLTPLSVDDVQELALLLESDCHECVA